MNAICHVMLDLKTLGTRPGAIVLSAAFVRFEDEGHCSLNLDQTSQTLAGCHFDQQTLNWWQKQDPATWQQATVNSIDTYAALIYFTQWLQWARNGRDLFIWCHGAGFDAPLLGELYRVFGLPTPWDFWNVRDTRTLYDLTGVDLREYSTGRLHVALNDALAQTRAANEALQRIMRLRGVA